MNKDYYRVLLVDDEPWNRDILRNLGTWDELGMVVAGEAEDGGEAIRLVEGSISPILSLQTCVCRVKTAWNCSRR